MTHGHSLLGKHAAQTPDDNCVSCGAGVWDYVPLDQLHKQGIPSSISGAETMTVCSRCAKLEEMLSQQSGTNVHPERLAHYERMERDYAPSHQRS